MEGGSLVPERQFSGEPVWYGWGSVGVARLWAGDYGLHCSPSYPLASGDKGRKFFHPTTFYPKCSDLNG